MFKAFVEKRKLKQRKAYLNSFKRTEHKLLNMTGAELTEWCIEVGQRVWGEELHKALLLNYFESINFYDDGELRKLIDNYGSTIPYRYANRNKKNIPEVVDVFLILKDMINGGPGYITYGSRYTKVLEFVEPTVKIRRPTDEEIKEVMLTNGFKLKEQPDGSLDLNPYVYTAVRALIEAMKVD